MIWILHDILALDLTKAPFDAGSRCALAAILAFIAALLFGRPFIAHQRRRQRLENTERGDSKRLDELHLHKKSTPTMGGAIILFASTVPALILVGPGGSAVFLLIGLSAALGLVGFLDDWIKLRYPKRKGLSARGKLVLQLAIGAAAGAILLLLPSEIRTGGTVEELGDTLAFPWSSTWVLPLGVLFVPWVAIVVTSTSNAVNLTDGLDGLAIGSSTLVAATLTALALVVGDESMSASLGLFHIEDAGEIAVWGAALCGASLGFLWFNCHPAEIFMGDTGSLPLGGSIGLMAVLLRHELFLLVLGGVLVAEALSVILQVASYRLFGRRIFRIAPLHHHFQFLGWKETRITARFWIAGLLCAAVSVGSLALRG